MRAERAWRTEAEQTAVSASRARVALARELRHARHRSGLTGQAVARRAGVSQSKISKIETGKLTPSVAEVSRLVEALGSPPPEREGLVGLARSANPDAYMWRPYQYMSQHQKQQDIGEMESKTASKKVFEATFVPGLLQTPRYARVVFDRAAPRTPAELDLAVAARLDRQRVLADPGKRFQFLLAESVLRWRVCASDILIGQMRALIEKSRAERLRLGIVPFDAPLPEFPHHGFCVFDDRLVTVETFHCELVTHDPDDVAVYVEAFDALCDHALFDDDARAFLEQVVRQLGG